MNKYLSWLGQYRFEYVNFVIGFVILAFELSASRVVAPYIGTTIYTWTSIIGVILASLALGYGVGGYLADKRKRLNDVVLIILLSSASIFLVSIFKDSVALAVSNMEISLQLQAFILSLLLFTIPTFLLGMASPYLTRLSITKVSDSGKHISRLSAAGGLGSLVGVFLPGYFLFGWIGTRNILDILVLVLIISSFLLSVRYLLFLRLAMMFLVLTSVIFVNHGVKQEGIIEDTDSTYQRILVKDIVIDGQKARVLKTDNFGLQSGVLTENVNELYFKYLRVANMLAQVSVENEDYLIIGGGAYTLPEKLSKDRTNSKVDVIEIDPKLESIAKKYFDFEQSQQINVINADGRQYLNTNSKLYDFIYIDAFNGLTMPHHLATIESVQLVKSSLVDTGLVGVNVVSASSGNNAQLIKSLVKTYKEVFTNVEVFKIDESESNDSPLQNLLLVASNRSLENEIQAITKREIPETTERLKIDFSSGLKLVDDFAPTEYMMPVF